MILPRLSRIEELLVNNSPTLLTAVGVTGVVATAALSVKAGFHYRDILEDLEAKQVQLATYEGCLPSDIPPVTNREKFDASWKTFAPPVCVGLLTISAVVGANHIGTRRAAGLAAAFTLSERAYQEYKEKIVSTIGPDKETKVRAQIAQDQVARTPGASQIIISGTDELFHDAYTGRYFRSNMEAVKKAQNDLNYKVLNDGYASLSEFYELLGLPATTFSEEVGWRAEQILDIQFSPVFSEDQKPCISIAFHHMPVRGYYKFG